MRWSDFSREIAAEASSPRAAAGRIRRRFNNRAGLRRDRACVTELGNASWSVEVVSRQASSYLYSAVVTGVLRETPTGCRFDGKVRPGWGTFLCNVTLVAGCALLLPVLGRALLPGATRAGSWWTWLLLVCASGAMTVGLARMFSRDLKRLVDDLEAEFPRAMRQ